ncbi:MAG TPA: MFS transporter, partial [Trebonia sp.]|nr:MFS transporter [Trebonia sp.]
MTRLGSAYWRLWWANAVSYAGDGALVSALPLFAVTVTKDPRLISLVSAAMFLPWLLLSLPAGAIVDRHDRVALMWRSQAVQFAVMAVLTILIMTRTAGIAVLAAAGFLLGCAEVVFSNAEQSALPALVPADLLPRANGNQQVVLTIGETFAGPPLGSALFAVRAALPFGLDAVSFAGSAALLAGLPRTAQSRAKQSNQRMRAQIAEGVRWLAGHRLLRTVALLLGVSNFSSQMGQATLVLLATQTLHVGTRGYGLLWTAAAIGSVLGGLVNPAITRRLGLLTSLIVAMAAFAALDVGIGLAPDFAVAAALMACNGFFVTMWNVVTVTMRQRIVPAELLGRVNSVYRMLGWGLMPLGALAGGFIAHAAGLRAAYVVAGVLSGAALLAALPALTRAASGTAGLDKASPDKASP